MAFKLYIARRQHDRGQTALRDHWKKFTQDVAIYFLYCIFVGVLFQPHFVEKSWYLLIIVCKKTGWTFIRLLPQISVTASNFQVSPKCKPRKSACDIVAMTPISVYMFVFWHLVQKSGYVAILSSVNFISIHEKKYIGTTIRTLVWGTLKLHYMFRSHLKVRPRDCRKRNTCWSKCARRFETAAKTANCERKFNAVKNTRCQVIEIDE